MPQSESGPEPRTSTLSDGRRLRTGGNAKGGTAAQEECRRLLSLPKCTNCGELCVPWYNKTGQPLCHFCDMPFCSVQCCRDSHLIPAGFTPAQLATISYSVPCPNVMRDENKNKWSKFIDRYNVDDYPPLDPTRPNGTWWLMWGNEPKGKGKSTTSSPSRGRKG